MKMLPNKVIIIIDRYSYGCVIMYYGLTKFIKHIEQTMNIHICIKDYIGFIPIKRELYKAIISNLSHSNPYCMYIKSDLNVYLKCTGMINKMCKKLESVDRCFCGVCHAGVKEYIAPIRWKNMLIGSVNAGVFQADDRMIKRRIHRTCKSSDLNEDTALMLYYKHINLNSIDEDALIASLGIIANTIALAFESISSYSKFEKKKLNTVVVRDTIIADALEYLKQNFTQQLKVEQIAKICHCSVSCLSHLFKSRVGISIPVYLNHLRIEKAKQELCDMEQSIATVADKSGFVDPNYFSRIFTRYVGLTPTSFRKSLLRDKDSDSAPSIKTD